MAKTITLTDNELSAVVQGLEHSMANYDRDITYIDSQLDEIKYKRGADIKRQRDWLRYNRKFIHKAFVEADRLHTKLAPNE